jgi:hypothetical protein
MSDHLQPHLNQNGECVCDCPMCTNKETVCICPECDARSCGLHEEVDHDGLEDPAERPS